MEVRFDILPEDLAAFGKYVAKNRQKTRATRPLKEIAWRFLLVVTTILQFFVGPAILFAFFPSKEAGPPAFLLVICQFVCLIVSLVAKQMLSTAGIVRRGHDKANGVVIDPDWFRSFDQLCEVSHRWSDIKKIGVTDKYLFFLVTSTRGYILPRRAFADDDAWIQFRDSARSYFESANAADENPYKEVT
jgi:hypothetical protein